MKTYNVQLIAKYFISKSTPGTRQNITNLKLQKILYYAQGFYASMHEGNLLFNSDIQAWKHGPVIPDIYHTYKSYNFHEIDEYVEEDFNELLSQDKEFLDKIWDILKNFSGKQLEYLTHLEDPWKEKEPYISTRDKDKLKIEVDSIVKYFKENHFKK